MSVLLSWCKRYDRFLADFPCEGYWAVPESSNSESSHIPVCFGELARTVWDHPGAPCMCSSRICLCSCVACAENETISPAVPTPVCMVMSWQRWTLELLRGLSKASLFFSLGNTVHQNLNCFQRKASFKQHLIKHVFLNTLVSVSE